MLYEEQAAELLRRCEALAGRELVQTRGNLSNSSTRAEAVWELLVLEAVSQLGPVECESLQGGPDIRLQMPSGRWLSIEVTYLHRRFEKEEHRCQAVLTWVAEAERTIAPRVSIETSFERAKDHPAGARLVLPLEHERRRFLARPDVAAFLSAVRAHPSVRHEKRLSDYSITLRSRPRALVNDEYGHSSSPVLESPKIAAEHAAFRALRSKIEQHKVDEPYLVCIGSDVSRVLSDGLSGFNVRLQDALGAAVRPSGRLSAVLVVTIETKMPILAPLTRRAEPALFCVSECKHPLSSEEVSVLRLVDLNRWRFTFPLQRRETEPRHRRPRVSGGFKLSDSARGTMKVTVPAPVLVDVLAGKTTLLDELGRKEGGFGQSVHGLLQKGWAVVGCKFMPANLEQALGAAIELELAPAHHAVFWRERDT